VPWDKPVFAKQVFVIIQDGHEDHWRSQEQRLTSAYLSNMANKLMENINLELKSMLCIEGQWGVDVSVRGAWNMKG